MKTVRYRCLILLPLWLLPFRMRGLARELKPPAVCCEPPEVRWLSHNGCAIWNKKLSGTTTAQVLAAFYSNID